MIIGDTRDYLFDIILPKNCICAEIGVYRGVNSDRIINLSNPKELYLIDIWSIFGNYKKHLSDEKAYIILNETRNNYKYIKDKYKDNKNIKIIKEDSVKTSKQFEDNYFDWVYIDAAHDYESVKKDIDNWWPKVKKNGYLCGHDYELKNPGIIEVKRAVDEFIKSNNLELYYKGIGDDKTNKSAWDGPSDWAIKK